MINRDAVLDRLQGLYLAARDFYDVGLVVDYLLNLPSDAALPKRVRHVLEAGMVVTYVRPFTNKVSRRVKLAGGLEQDLRDFHEDLVSRRNSVYAHTDQGDFRRILDFDAPTTLDALLAGPWDAVVLETWDSLTDRGLRLLAELGRRHFDQVLAEIVDVRRIVSTTPPIAPGSSPAG